MIRLGIFKLALLVILFIFVVSMELSSCEKISTVVDNSPYPEFIYIDKDILPEIVEIHLNRDIPSFLFYFIDGVYIDGQSGGVAVKTPLWFIVKLLKMLNLFSEELKNIYPENGFLFIDSTYKGAPEKDYREKYLVKDYDDLIVYLNDSVLCAKFDKNNTTYFVMAVDRERVSYNDEDDETLVKLINGLKSINGLKIKRSHGKIEGNMVVIDVVLEAGISDIEKLKNIDLTYVPITVKVKGDWIREGENKYVRNLDYMMIYATPLNRDTTLSIINNRELNKELNINLKEKSKEYEHNGWYVEEYLYTYRGFTTKTYVCTKELEYGTVCVITNKLENLEDIQVYENKPQFPSRV